MDLASFIPGVNPTALFTPGSTTPPPFNVSHTGLTDGTSPTTASNNMAEIYNRILLNIAATVVTAGIPIDHNNWAQLPQAVTALVNQGVSAFTSSIVTPPQFDNDGSIATTAFVQRALGNASTVVDLFANTTLSSADAGKVFTLWNANGITISINPGGLVAGSTFTFISSDQYTNTLASAGGFRPITMFPLATSVTLMPRSQYTFVWDGNNFWPINGGASNVATSYTVDGGYTRFPDGLTLQWGADTTAIGETSRTVMFGQSFPVACRCVMLTGLSDTSVTNNNIPQLVSTNVSSFTYFNQSITEPTVPIQPNQGIRYFAFGN